MPNRILRDWTDSPRLEQLSADAERLFVRLIMKADDFGRFHADVRLLKAGCFPLIPTLRDADVSRWLAACEKAGLIVVYRVKGRSYLAIKGFAQRTRQVSGKFPQPKGEADGWLPSHDDYAEESPECLAGKRQPIDGQLTVNRQAIDGLDGDGDGDGDGDEDSFEPSADADAAKPTPAPLLIFPVVGGDRTWPLTPVEVDVLRSAFPHLDILAESRKALSWAHANPAKRKTARGMVRFLHRWMERAQNDRGGTAPETEPEGDGVSEDDPRMLALYAMHPSPTTATGNGAQK